MFLRRKNSPDWTMFHLKRNLIIFFSLKNPGFIFFRDEKKFLRGIFESFFVRFRSIFAHHITRYLFIESSVYLEKNAILMFFIHLVILI